MAEPIDQNPPPPRRWRYLIMFVNFLTTLRTIIALSVTLIGLLPMAIFSNAGPPTPTEEFNFILVGLTGSGKSTSGNTILDKHVFKTGFSTNSITKEFQVESAIVLESINVTVVDGPGLGDTEISDEISVKMVIAEVEKALAHIPEGFDAILMTQRLGRHTEQDRKTFTQLKAIFGEDILQNKGILLVTFGEEFNTEKNKDSFEDWLDKQKGHFKEILADCYGRALLVDNKSKDSNVRTKQREQLFEIVRDMQKKENKRYTKKHFDYSQEDRKTLLVKLREPELRKKFAQKIKNILIRFAAVNLNDVEQAKRECQCLKNDAGQLLQEIKFVDNGTGVFKDIIQDQMIDTVAAIDGLLQTVDQRTAEEIQKLRRGIDVKYDYEMQRKDEYKYNIWEMAASFFGWILELLVQYVGAPQRKMIEYRPGEVSRSTKEKQRQKQQQKKQH